jgi:hypothetical protein
MAFFKAKLQFVFVQGSIIDYIEIVQKQFMKTPIYSWNPKLTTHS